jgi:hypothetical protein
VDAPREQAEGSDDFVRAAGAGWAGAKQHGDGDGGRRRGDGGRIGGGEPEVEDERAEVVLGELAFALAPVRYTFGGEHSIDAALYVFERWKGWRWWKWAESLA